MSPVFVQCDLPVNWRRSDSRPFQASSGDDLPATVILAAGIAVYRFRPIANLRIHGELTALLV